jgi:hypothetical protein
MKKSNVNFFNRILRLHLITTITYLTDKMKINLQKKILQGHKSFSISEKFSISTFMIILSIKDHIIRIEEI